MINKHFDFKKLIPHGVAVLLFALITLVYFYPMFQGKQLDQHDVSTWKGMSKEIQDHREIFGEEPLWTNSLFGGMPAYYVSTISEANLVRYIAKTLSFGIRPASILFLYLIGFYILLLTLKIDPWLSIAGAIAFGLSSYFLIIIEAGHNSKATAIAYMPLITAGLLLTFRSKYILGLGITAISLALQLAANHLQITYYLLITLAIFGVIQLASIVKEKKFSHLLKISLALSVAVLLAVGSNITKILSGYLYSEHSTRGKSELVLDEKNQTTGLDKDYATQWSYGVTESFSLLVPEYKGGASGVIGNDKSALKKADPRFRQNIASQNHYWGNQPFTSGPVYVGAIICFLFILGAFIVQGWIKWWLVSATLLSVMLAWGKNFMPLTDFFMDYVPLYNKFRAVSMILVIAEFCMPVLAILAVKKVIEDPDIINKKKKAFGISFGLTGGLALLMFLLPDMTNTFVSDQESAAFYQQIQQNPQASAQFDVFISNLEEVRKSIFRSDALRSFIFIALGGLAIFLFAKKKINRKQLGLGLAALILIDLWPVNKRYLNNEDFVPKKQAMLPYQPTSSDIQILQNEFGQNKEAQELYTTLLEKHRDNQKKPLTDIEKLDLQFTALNFHSNYRVLNLTVSTFNDAHTSYFHKSVGGYHGAKMQRYQDLISFHLSQRNPDVINMLNTKYIIMPKENRQPQVRENPDRLGNAWFVKGLKSVPDANAEIEALNDFNPAETAIIDKRFSDHLEGFQPDDSITGNIRMTKYKPNHLVYESSTADSEIAVFSEIYYPDGWKVLIDGEKADHFRVNYVLRGMIVPSGKHTIEFRFEPQKYKIGERISLATSFLLLLFVAGTAFYTVRNNVRRNKDEQ